MTSAAPGQNQKNGTSLSCLCNFSAVQRLWRSGNPWVGREQKVVVECDSECQGLPALGGWKGWWMGKRHGLDQQLWSEEREARGGIPWGKYIFHPSLTLISAEAPQSPVVTSRLVAQESVGGVVDIEVQSLKVTFGSQRGMLK